MKKVLEYKGRKFLIKITLDYIVDRTPDGKRVHRVIVNDMGGNNYYQEYQIEDKTMISDIEGIIRNTEAYVDSISVIDKRIDALKVLGFEE